MKEARGKPILISQNEYWRIKYKLFKIFILIPTFFMVLSLLCIIYIDLLQIRIFFLIIFLVWIHKALAYVNNLKRRPLLLYENGLTFPQQTDFLQRLFVKYDFIHFDDIKEVELRSIDSKRHRIDIIAKNGKIYFLIIDFFNDYYRIKYYLERNNNQSRFH